MDTTTTRTCLQVHQERKCILNIQSPLVLLALAIAAQAVYTGDQMTVDLNDPNQVATAKKLFGGKQTTRFAAMPDDKVFLSEIHGPVNDGKPEIAKVHKAINDEVLVTAQTTIEGIEYSGPAAIVLCDLFNTVRGESTEISLDAIADTEIDLGLYAFGTGTDYKFVRMVAGESGQKKLIDAQYDRDNGTWTFLSDTAAYTVSHDVFVDAYGNKDWKKVSLAAEKVDFGDDIQVHSLLRTTGYRFAIVAKAGGTVPYTYEGVQAIEASEATIEIDGMRITLMPTIENDGDFSGNWTGIQNGELHLSKTDRREVWSVNIDQALEDLVPADSPFLKLFGKKPAAIEQPSAK